jgi:hypothetical protein
VAALDAGGVRWLPGSLDGVVPVRLDWNCPREAYRVVRHEGRQVIAAAGYPRDIPDVPRERNLQGVSFAVANASGFVARALEACPGAPPSGILEALADASRNRPAGLGAQVV